jgi:ABC-2 type transport system permease protein
MSTPNSGRETRGLESVKLIAGRELKSRLNRGFYISTAITMAVVVIVVIVSQLIGGSDKSFTVGITGTDTAELTEVIPAVGQSTDVKITVREYADPAGATAALGDGKVDAVVVDDRRLLAKSSVDVTLRGVLEAAHQQITTERQVRAAGLKPDAAAAALSVAPLSIDTSQAGGKDDSAKRGVAYIGTILLYGQLILYGTWVAMGVVEEKASRVVELLLSTIRPWQLLMGKVIGIGLLGFAQILAIGVTGIVAGLGTGAIDLPAGVIATVADVIVWFVLGYAFYACAFAAAASLASRQEDLQNVTAPLSLVLVASFFLALFTLEKPDGGLAKVVSIVPPFSAMTMPSRAARGDVSVLQFGAAVVLMLAAIGALVWFAGRIYSRAVLHTGARLSWKQALQLGEKAG